MSILRTSVTNPDTPPYDPLSRAIVRQGLDPKTHQREELAERHATWRAWLETREGQAARELAEPKIQWLQSLLAMSSERLAERVGGRDTNFLSEIRAETRGQIQVWVEILKEPERIKAQLDLLDKAQPPLPKGQKGWESMPKNRKEGEPGERKNREQG